MSSGWFDFSVETEENDREIFRIVNNVRSKLQPKDGKTGGLKTLLEAPLLQET